MSLLKWIPLWKRTTKDRKSMLAGYLSDEIGAVILPNAQKTNDNQPDYFLFLSTDYKRKNVEAPQNVAEQSEGSF